MARISRETIKQRGGWWYCNFTDRHTGERMRDALKTAERDAALRRVLDWQQWCEDRAAARKLGRAVPPRPGARASGIAALTLGDLLDEYWQEHGKLCPSARSLAKRLKNLRRLMPLRTRLSELHTQLAHQFVLKRRGEAGRPRAGAREFGVPLARVANTTINGDLTALAAAVNWGRAIKGYSIPPLDLSVKTGAKLKPLKYRQPTLTESDLRTVYMALDPDARQFFWFAYWSTLRLANCASLKKTQIVWEGTPDAPRGTVTVYQKGNRPHSIALDHTMRALLETACAQSESDYVFTWRPMVTQHFGRRASGLRRYEKGQRYPWIAPDGRLLSAIDWRWREARQRAGVRPTTWHAATRGGGITRLVKAGNNLAQVQLISGHSSLVTLMGYVNLDEASQLAVLQAGDIGFNPIAGRDGTHSAHRRPTAGRTIAISGG